MASLDGGFNANDVEPNVGFEPIPTGDYLVVITASERQATKDGSSQLLKLDLQIIDGQHKGRTLFDRLNLWNKNQQATEIARGTLSAICRAVGVMQPRDTCELHNIPLVASVKIEKRQDNGEYANRISAYKPRHGATQPQAVNVPPPQHGIQPQQAYPQGGFQQQAPVAAGAGAKAPWQR